MNVDAWDREMPGAVSLLFWVWWSVSRLEVVGGRGEKGDSHGGRCANTNTVAGRGRRVAPRLTKAG